MNPDVDGGAVVPPQESGSGDLDVKKILLMQDEMIKQQAKQIADLSKQIGALAARPQADAVVHVSKSPQDMAFEAMLKSYGLVKADKEE